MRKVFRDWLLICGFVLLTLLIFGSFALAQNVGQCPCHVGGAACYCQPASICPNCPNPANLRDAPAVQYVSYQVGATKAPPVKMPMGPADCPTGTCPAGAAPAARFPAVHAALERQPVRTAARRVVRFFSRLRGARGCG